jgi:hypothetical protein
MSSMICFTYLLKLENDHISTFTTGLCAVLLFPLHMGQASMGKFLLKEISFFFQDKKMSPFDLRFMKKKIFFCNQYLLNLG